MNDIDDEVEILHVFDLPQLYQKPSKSDLIQALDVLSNRRGIFPSKDVSPKQQVNATGVPAYLTAIVASSLDWLPDDSDREQVWSLAAQRLAERAGRTAVGNLHRQFDIPLPSLNHFGSETSEKALSIQLNEPALTADNLGLKTWAASYVLAQRLGDLKVLRPFLLTKSTHAKIPSILELGAGTGLLGLAAAAIFRSSVLLTDLASIVPNLRQNVTQNVDMLSTRGGSAKAAVLDWNMPAEVDYLEDDATESQQRRTYATNIPPAARPQLILAADPVYDPAHVELLVQTIVTWLRPLQWEGATTEETKPTVVIAYPIRTAYVHQMLELRQRMENAGLKVVDTAREEGVRDDWEEDVVVEIVSWQWQRGDGKPTK